MRRCACLCILAIAGFRAMKSGSRAEPEGRCPEQREECSVAPCQPPGPVELDLKPPVAGESTRCSVSGRVRRHDGSPEPGCEVEALVADDSGDLTRSVAKVTTDPEGRFHCSGLAGVRTKFTASVELLDASLELILAPGESREDLDLTLPEEWRPLVRVTDENGLALSGNQIQLRIDLRRFPLGLDGLARPRLTLEPHEFRAWGDVGETRSYVSREYVIAEPFATEVRVSLAEFGYAEGILLDPDGVEILNPELITLVDGEPFGHSFRSNSGRFRVYFPIGKSVTLVPAEPWISGQAEDSGERRYFSGSLGNVRADDRNLVLRTRWADSDGSLTVRCVSPDGSSISGFEARLWLKEAWALDRGRAPLMVAGSDESGAATFARLHEFSVVVEVSPCFAVPEDWIAPSSASAVPGEDDLVFAFRRGEWIQGHTVRTDGSAISDAWVRAEDPRSGYAASANTDAEGAFRLLVDPSLPGPYRVKALVKEDDHWLRGTVETAEVGGMPLRLQMKPEDP